MPEKVFQVPAVKKKYNQYKLYSEKLRNYEIDTFFTVLKEVSRNSKFLESKNFIQHGNTSVLKHSVSVAYVSFRVASLLNLPVDMKKLIRGALLHDYFLYDWHVKDKSHRLHGFRHPYTAYRNASRDINLSKIEKDIITRHMFPLTPIPPIYMESILVCTVDKLCSLYETFYFNKLKKCKKYNIWKKKCYIKVV